MKPEIFLLSTDETAQLSPQYSESLFPKRAERARKFRRKEDRLRCIGAGALLHGVLGIREQDLYYTAHSKPYVRDGSVCFNLSHSGKYILLAVDRFDIGADIEQLSSARLSLTPKVLLPEEQKWVQEAPLPRFFTVWTLKESLMKQCGRGLSLSPDSFSVMPLLSGGSLQINGNELFAATTVWEDYCISVCTTHPIEQIAPKRVSARELLQK